MRYIKKFENIEEIKSKFKIGDYVVCIDDSDAVGGRIRKGNLYKVTNVHVNEYTQEEFYKLNGDYADWREYRFRKATDEEISANKYNL